MQGKCRYMKGNGVIEKAEIMKKIKKKKFERDAGNQ